MALVPELEKIRRAIEAVNADVRKVTDDLSEEQLAWRPQPGRWSIAENLVHLNLGTQSYIPEFDRTIEDARARGLRGEGPFGVGLIGRLFVGYLEPPYRMKSKAPRMIAPLLQGTAKEAVQQFLRSQEALLTRVEAANGLDLGRARFISPLASALRMNLLAAFATVTAHQRRHLWQSWHIRAAMDGKMKAAN